MHLRCCVSRRPGFVVLNVALPTTVIALFSCTTFFVDPLQVSAKLDLSVTILLTAVAFKYAPAEARRRRRRAVAARRRRGGAAAARRRPTSCQHSTAPFERAHATSSVCTRACRYATAAYLPQISYLTLVDKFVLLCSCMIAVTYLVHALIGSLTDWAEVDHATIEVVNKVRSVDVLGLQYFHISRSPHTSPPLPTSPHLSTFQVCFAAVLGFWFVLNIWFVRAALVARKSDSETGQKRALTRRPKPPLHETSLSDLAPEASREASATRHIRVRRTATGTRRLFSTMASRMSIGGGRELELDSHVANDPQDTQLAWLSEAAAPRDLPPEGEDGEQKDETGGQT